VFTGAQIWVTSSVTSDYLTAGRYNCKSGSPCPLGSQMGTIEGNCVQRDDGSVSSCSYQTLVFNGFYVYYQWVTVYDPLNSHLHNLNDFIN
jgi:hypothetical protein